MSQVIFAPHIEAWVTGLLYILQSHVQSSRGHCKMNKNKMCKLFSKLH